MRKAESFTIDKVNLIIIRNTRKIQSLFNNKDKIKHNSCVMYRGICSCGVNYIGETIRNEISEMNCLKRKILEAYYIKTCQPSLSNEIKSDVLSLFRNGVTQNCSFLSLMYLF